MNQQAQREAAKPPIEIVCSRDFLAWLHAEKISLAFTTYQTSRLFFIGLKPDGALSAFERLFDHAMGLYATPDTLYMSSRYQLWRFENSLAPDELYKGYDRLYVPRMAHTTGDLDIHDVVVDKNNDVVFVNTLHSCLAKISNRYSFKSVWSPPFISKLAHEDRCHLNGLALVNGEPGYVTAVSRSDVAAGWRERRRDGGVVVDIKSSEIISSGLSMPHSPRFYKNRLWVLNSGKGDFGYIDMNSGEFMPIAFCPGYMRGLAFCGDYAIIGLSKPRNRVFSGLELDDRLKTKDAEPKCGFVVIDINTGDIAHWMHLEGVVTELYDVQILPGVRRPMALGMKNKDIWRIITIEGEPDEQGRKRPLTSQLPKKPLSSKYEFKIETDLTPASAMQYDGMSFPRLSTRWQALPPKGGLDVVTALVDGQPVGACIAESRPDNVSAEIISLCVAHIHRNQGVAGKLVSRMEKCLAQKGLKGMDFTFRSNWEGATAMEQIGKDQEWSSPKTIRIIAKSTIETISRAPWLDTPLPDNGFEIFSWVELTEDEKNDIKRQQEKSHWFPPILSPFQEQGRIEPATSIGVRYKGEVVGWSITHRVAPDTIQNTAAFFREDIRGTGLAISVAAEAARRRIAAKIPKTIFMIDAKNEHALNIFNEHIRPYVESIAEARFIHKMIGRKN